MGRSLEMLREVIEIDTNITEIYDEFKRLMNESL